MHDWTLIAKLPEGQLKTETFTGADAWADARDTLVDAYLDNGIDQHNPLQDMFCDASPDEPIFLSIAGFILALQPANARFATCRIDGGTEAVIDTKHGLEVAVCGDYLIEVDGGDEAEIDNSLDRARLIASALNSIGADFPGREDLAARFLADEGADQ